MTEPAEPAESAPSASAPAIAATGQRGEDVDPILLGVARSLSGRSWRLRAADERVAQAHSQRHGVPDVVGRAMAGRGVGVAEGRSYLAPTLRALLPDPSTLQDMDRAAARIVAAVQAGETIGVFGDYDVDGATSAAIVLRVLCDLGVPTRLHIPDRIAEGYGPNAPALRRLQADGASLVLCVDCGATATEPLAAAATDGLDVIVLDHHAVGAALPSTVAMVNPNRLDDTSGLGHLAACGVVFMTMVAVLRQLRQSGWFVDRPAPDLMGLLDLVALGTVCDVVPLTGLNRALVTQGLKVMGGMGRPGLAALARMGKIVGAPDTYHLGFILGPRINAAGRVGEADTGTRLLTTDDPTEAERLATQLDVHNDDRREIERVALSEAMALIDAGGEPGAALLVGDPGWHPGVIGIVAGRLKDRYHRPACVVAWDGDVGKGSGRSVPGVDLGGIIMEARAAGLLRAGGGHPMAAGFTVERPRFHAFERFLADRVAAIAGGERPRPAELILDGVLAVSGATVDLAEKINRMAPFGSGNSEPRFVVRSARILKADRVGTDHVRCLTTGQGGGRLSVIAFRCADEPLGQALLAGVGQAFHLAGTVKINRWNGRTDVQLQLTDAAPEGGQKGGPS